MLFIENHANTLNNAHCKRFGTPLFNFHLYAFGLLLFFFCQRKTQGRDETSSEQ